MGNVIFNNIKLMHKKETLLDIPSMDLPLDNIIAVVGAKDCGKSQFLNVLTGKTHSYTGTVAFDEALNKNDIFYVDSSTYLPSLLSVKELIDKYEKEYPNFSREVAIKYFDAMEIPTEKVNYRNFNKMVQVAINCILAIASRARITILDQPARNMPLKLRQMLYGFAKEDYENFKRTIIITSNIAVDIDNIANYVVYMRKAEIVFNLPYDEVDKFATGLLGREEIIKTYIGNTRVFYSKKEGNLVQKIVRNDISIDTAQSLALNGVISQYVNLVNFHTYVVKNDFAYDEKAKAREEALRIYNEKKALKESKKKHKKGALIAKDDTANIPVVIKQEEKKETFMEKLKRIMTSDIF